ncbi:MAG: hypothetical protein M1831_000372 [Alyxoria varia]|nr:MAG: hypothetical protein M1831_000372 [Alyxoria varia]
MSVNRGAASLPPFMLRSIARASRHRSGISSNSLRHQPIALLVSHSRLYSSGPSTSTHGAGAGGDFPPPGFNAEQAKKPLQQQQSNEAEKSEKVDIDSVPESERPKTSAGPQEGEVATSEPKTAPAEGPGVSERAEKSVAKKVEERKEDQKKLTVWQKVKKEANHYWDGTKLLGTETRISFKLALKMAAGYELTRREHRQFHRTVKDLGRLVPFSVFVIVPFAELLLPVVLRLFPNLLPSTYEGQKARDAKATDLRATRKEVSSFLRQTLRETGLPISAANAQRTEFINFFRKVRNTGEQPTDEDVIKVCKIFKDDLTLDNLSRPQLVGICRYMNLNTFGTDLLLRYHIRHRMRQIKRDDKAIAFEGVESLSVTELHTAAASRGLRTQGMSPGRLRDDLQMWLDLRLRYGVPSTLLVLSNAFVYAQGKETELSGQIDALQAVLASVPEELFHEIELEVHTAEGAATNKQRLEVLKEQQELIDEENEQSEEQGVDRDAQAASKDTQNIDEGDEQHPAQKDGQALAESATNGVDGNVAEPQSAGGSEDAKVEEKKA